MTSAEDYDMLNREQNRQQPARNGNVQNSQQTNAQTIANNLRS